MSVLLLLFMHSKLLSLVQKIRGSSMTPMQLPQPLQQLLHAPLMQLRFVAGVAVTLGLMRAAEVGQATANFFSGLWGKKPKPPS